MPFPAFPPQAPRQSQPNPAVAPVRTAAQVLLDQNTGSTLLTDLADNISVSLQLITEVATDSLIDTGVSLQTITEVIVDSLTNTATSISTTSGEQLFDAVTSTSVSVSSAFDANTDTVNNVSVEVSTIADLSFGADAVTSISTASEYFSEIIFDTVTEIQTQLGSLLEKQIDSISTSSIGVEFLSEVSQDSSNNTTSLVNTAFEIGIDTVSNTSTSVENVIDIVALSDFLSTAANNVGSISEFVLDQVFSTEIQVDALIEIVSEAISSLGVLSNSLSDFPTDIFLQLNINTQVISETLAETIQLLTTVQNIADLVEGGGDVFSSPSVSSAILNEALIDNTVGVAVSLAALSETFTDSVQLLSTHQLFVIDSFGTITEDVLTTQLSTQSIYDLIIESPPEPILPPVPAGYKDYRPPKEKKVVSREGLEKSVERLLDRKILPEYYSKGAQKAFKEFQKDYGSLEGKRIFLLKALEQGHGETILQKVNDVYATGTTVDQTKKMNVKIDVRQKKVSIISGHPATKTQNNKNSNLPDGSPIVVLSSRRNT